MQDRDIPEMQEEKKIRVAVVGSGLAGLTTAYLLARDTKERYEVEIFETGPSPSLDAASTTVTPPSSPPMRLDVPMRAFAGGFYTSLISLYTHLGIPYRRQSFLYTFSTTTTHHMHPSNMHRFPPKPTHISWTTHILQLALLYVVYVYFTLCVFLVSPAPGESLRCYLRRVRLPDWVTRSYLLPLFSAVATCPHDAMLDFPAADLVTYRKAVYAQPHYVVNGGVAQVQERLLEGVKIYFNRQVLGVESSGGGGVVVKWDGGEDIFDRVVLAVNPRVVGKIYRPLGKQMARVPCCEVEVVVHTDSSVLGDLFPGVVAQNEKAPLMGGGEVKAAERLLGASGAELIHLNTRRLKGGTQTQASHLYSPGVIVTTQPHKEVPSEKVLGGTKFTRVLRNCESREVVQGLVDRDGEGGVWVVGGWAWDGMVLLEECVVSAMRVARDFDVEVPW